MLFISRINHAPASPLQSSVLVSGKLDSFLQSDVSNRKALRNIIWKQCVKYLVRAHMLETRNSII